ncbi:Na+/H+ antiporter subunit G [Luteimonas terrae]|uniref:Multicomponent K+:H+ antiporter subunit G n=1 Tax=Luteimonas terrae TaxID=1530191 RepID=A0ABU1XZS3_9GAMM|nr:Na+/H+ antiporter subunit G [Luteimonas terrae]MDR7194198.1 multicomponent K+:H+ antiporter subunit G [Luteimonas terrae]
MSTLFEIVVVTLLVVGCFFTLLGGVAMVKLSDFFRRLHGPAKASTLGVGCILFASIIYHWVNGSGVHPRELLITVFLFLTAPISAHLMSRAALSLMDERPPHPERTPDADERMVDREDPAPSDRN